ncbi:MAG: hypothetical protein L6R36_002218 [Xanthoria steineri]|nr:MAG: hypothetical protein L6R36_002218 [Xanthoria steineri]
MDHLSLQDTEPPCTDAARAVGIQGNTHEIPPVLNEHTPRASEHCSIETRQRNTDRRFKKPTSFAFSQTIREHPSAPRLSDLPVLRTRGELHIREDHTAGLKSIRVESEVQHDDRCLVTLDGPAEKMTMTTILAPGCGRNWPQTSSSEPNVSAKVTVWISRGLDLSSFRIDTDSLDVIFHENVPIPKHTPISISAPFSAVTLTAHKLKSQCSIDARQTILTTQSGSVNGDFTLRDALRIHTLSGSININLSLLNSSNNTTTTPATLDLQSQSGSIKVATTTILTPSKIPDRDYHSTLRTQSGSIRTTLVHGTSTTLHSSSSSIHAFLYPHGAAASRSDLITNNLSGSTDITVHPSLSHPPTLRNFHASHTGISGSIRILYPAQWEGTVQGSTVSGSIRYAWPGLQVVESGGGWGRKTFKGVKGVGDGVVAFRAVSGSVELKGMEAAEGSLRVEEEEEEEEVVLEEAQRAVDGEEESVRDHGRQQQVLTPGSEAGDEWLVVQ